MEKLKVTEIYKLTILSEMLGTCINKKVDKDFYMDSLFQSIDWLIENREKIAKDFLSILNDLIFEFSHNYYYKVNKWIYPDCSKDQRFEFLKMIIEMEE